MADTPALDHVAARGELRGALHALGAEVDRVKQTRGFQATLEAMARFWHYSPLNEWFIVRACPRATRVTGRRTAAAKLDVVVEPLVGSNDNLGESRGGTIAIRPGLSPRERAATLAHELAHELLHADERARNRRRTWTHAERSRPHRDRLATVTLRWWKLGAGAPTVGPWQSR